ncbi:MAG: AAA family ATPase [Patescibacteria group bacterium]
MPRSKKIVITGIPGSGSTRFCNEYAVADPSRLEINSYHSGNMLLTLAQETPQKPPITPENLLNLNPELLAALENRVFDSILASVANKQEKCDRLVIDLHAQFFWNDVFINAYDWRHLRQLNPDMFITLIEKPSTVRERQLATPQGRVQNHSLRDLLLWSNAEVNTVEGLASNLGKPHYVLPGRQDPLTIESLLASAFLIYFQMPMTDASSEADQMITKFKEKLLTLGRRLTGLPTPLIDPRMIDMESNAGLSAKEELIIRRHTVHRDLNWYIPKASDQVAYYPLGTTLSKGVSDECTRGFETGKNVFVIWPSQHASPFMDIATKVFPSEEAFFEFFSDYMPQRIKELKRVN